MNNEPIRLLASQSTQTRATQHSALSTQIVTLIPRKRNALLSLFRGKVDVFDREGVNVRIANLKGVITNKVAYGGVVSVNAKAMPQDNDDDDNGSDALVPILILSGLVAIAAIYISTNVDDNRGAFVSATS